MNKKQQEILNDSIGKTVLISIGINHYSNNDEFGNLKKCINDATEIYNVFKKVTPLNLNKDKSILMISDEKEISTSKDEIINKIKEVCKKVTYDEKLVLFFSGHGHVLDNNNYLVPSNYGNATKEELLCINDVVNILEGSQASVKVILMDACCSGVIDKKSKGLEEGSFKNMKDYIKSTRATVIMAACGKNESATEESPNSKLSLFTTYLVEGLEGKVEALDNGYLTINSLYDYVLKQMRKVSREYTQINQSPNLNVKTNNIAIIGLYNYKLDNDDDDFDNYYEVKVDESKMKSVKNPYIEVQKKGKILIPDNLWYETQMFLNEMILNIFDHGSAENCNLLFSNNKIILSSDGNKFDPTKNLLNSKPSSPEGGNGLYVFNLYVNKNLNCLDVSYEYTENLNKLIVSFKNLKAFDIEGLCRVEVKEKWLSRYSKEDLILPEGNCKKYYYIIDMISPCISIGASAVNTILSAIPSESKLVVIDKNEGYLGGSRIHYKPNPRIIYRDK